MAVLAISQFHNHEQSLNDRNSGGPLNIMLPALLLAQRGAGRGRWEEVRGEGSSFNKDQIIGYSWYMYVCMYVCMYVFTGP